MYFVVRSMHYIHIVYGTYILESKYFLRTGKTMSLCRWRSSRAGVERFESVFNFSLVFHLVSYPALLSCPDKRADMETKSNLGRLNKVIKNMSRNMKNSAVVAVEKVGAGTEGKVNITYIP